MLCKLELLINIKVIKGNGIISGEIKIEVVMVLSAIFKLNKHQRCKRVVKLYSGLKFGT